MNTLIELTELACVVGGEGDGDGGSGSDSGGGMDGGGMDGGGGFGCGPEGFGPCGPEGTVGPTTSEGWECNADGFASGAVECSNWAD